MGRAWAERWLSPERFEPYLAACDGDAERALDLYEWNADLAQVVMREICHFEIALRNAYDRVMRERWEGDWLLDDGSPARVPLMRKSGRGELDANYTSRHIIDVAAAGLPRNFPHGALVASLTLGSGSTSPTAPARPRYGGRASTAHGRRGRGGRSSSAR